MSTDLAERRKGRALSLLLLAAAMAAVAAITVAIEMRASRPDLASGPVIPGLEQTIMRAERVTVASTDANYRIERVERGDARVWIMRDRGDFPVADERMERLFEGIEQLRYTRRMTSDASKHERLGVGDPRQGGRGVLVQVEDGRGALLVNLILGVEPGGLYVRRPDNDQTWAARGELPPLRDVSVWLDLQPLQLAADALTRVEVVPVEGRPYVLARETPQAAWRLASPTLTAAANLATTAERLVALAPTDVQPAPAVQGAPRGHVIAQTFEGVTIEGELLESQGRVWLKLVARAANPEQEAAALTINERVAAWAYALSDDDARALAPPLNVILAGAN